MQILGLCRFSFPATDGFQILHDTVEDRRAHLYSPARLEERFRLFETTTLPCFREQTDPDFDLILLTGTCLPKPFLERLQDVTTDVRQIRIVQKDAAPHKAVVRDVLNTARQTPDQPCIQFRNDDDDAVSVDFVERLRRTANDNAGLMQRYESVGIDFNAGYLARFGSDGVQATGVMRSLLAVGLGMFVQGGSSRTIFDRLHNRLARFMPVISQPDAPMWVRGLNGFNDSPHARTDKTELRPLTSQQAGEFIARFAIDSDAVKAAHSKKPDDRP